MKVAVIGAALRGEQKTIGYWHASHYQELGQEVMALADTDLDGAGRLAKEKNIWRIFYSYKDMLDKLPELEVISIATPPVNRNEIIKDCLAAGKHLLLEKPLEVKLDKAAEVEQIVQQHNDLICGMCFPWRFSQAAEKIREGVKKYGKIKHVSLLSHTPWLFKDSWRVYPEQGGGELFEHGVHFVDLVRYMAGEIKSVYAKGEEGENRGFPFVHALLEFKSGALGSLTIAHGMKNFDNNHQLESTVLYEDGALHCRMMERPDRDSSKHCSYRQENVWFRGADKPEEPSYYWFGHKDIISDFLDAIKQKRPPRATVHDGLQDMRVIYAIQRAIKEKAEINVA